MSTIIHHKNNLTFHESSKHIKAHCNLIKNKLEDDLVKLLSIFSSFQFTDLSNKPVDPQAFKVNSLIYIYVSISIII